MADNVVADAGAGGATFAADDIGGVHYPRTKIALGADGAATDALGGTGVDAAGVMRVSLATNVPLPAGTNALGKLTANSGVDIGDVDVTSVIPGVGATNLGKAEDAAHLTDDTGVAMLAVRRDAAASGVDADGDYVYLSTDANGLLRVNASGVAVPVTDNAGSLTVDGTVTANLAAGTNNIGDVDVLSIAAGNNNIGDVDIASIAAGDNNIGNVDIASIAAGDNNIGNVDIVTMPNVTLAAGTNTNEVVGDIAHDTAATTNPLPIAGIAQDMDDTAPPNQVSAENDTTRIATDRDGAVFVHPFGPRIWSYHEDSSSALTDASVHAAPAAGLSLYVTDIVISTGAATAMNVFFEEGASKVLGPFYLEAVAGRGAVIRFTTPKKITAATALTVTTSAAIAHSIDVTGFIAQG